MGESNNARAFVGHFVPWDGGSVFIGSGGGVVPVHAHYSIQIAFGVTPGIRFRSSDSEEWIAYDGAIIPSRQPHSMDVVQMPTCAVLFVEPETREGHALNERWLRHGIANIPGALLDEGRSQIFAAWQEERSAAAVAKAGRRIIQSLTGGVEPAVVADERIIRAIAHVNANLHLRLSLDEVADVACLSPSRFRHLFVEQTGMALRPYILWRRFLHVWELLSAGATLSSAAHAAGFADAAHLSRTSRTMFGIAPSAMQMAQPLGGQGPAGRDSAVVAGKGAYREHSQPLRSRT